MAVTSITLHGSTWGWQVTTNNKKRDYLEKEERINGGATNAKRSEPLIINEEEDMYAIFII